MNPPSAPTRRNPSAGRAGGPRPDGRARRSRAVAVALLALAAPGCSADDGLGRRAVSGEVTLDGRPLARGSILLEPESGRVGTAVGALVRDGRFAIAREKGPAPGRYLVRVYAASDVQAAPPPGASDRVARPMVELIPARYNARSTLRAEVTPGGPNAFRVAMQTDGPPPERPDRAVPPFARGPRHD